MLSTKADLEINFSDMIKLGEIFGVKAKACTLYNFEAGDGPLWGGWRWSVGR